jgi:hypothetical protein
MVGLHDAFTTIKHLPVMKDVDPYQMLLNPSQKIQHCLSQELAEMDHKSILGTLQGEDKLHFMSGSTPQAGAWLTASPMLKCNQLVQGNFTLAVKLRLGLPIITNYQGPCKLCSNGFVDAQGTHAFRCNRIQGFRTARHTHVNDTIFSIVNSMADNRLVVRKEASLEAHVARQNTETGANSAERFADILITNANGSVRSVLDTTISHPTLETAGALSKIGAQAELKQKIKIKKYTETYQLEDSQIIPFAMETYGAWNPMSIDYLRNLAKEAAAVSQKPYSVLYRQATERISVALQRMNAYVLRRLEASCPSKTRRRRRTPGETDEPVPIA